ncbi:zinc finger protein CONSTANS-LIKE 8 [Hevea brasiliensis]|uniref:zinc finger protein CONSTANS-LIKE 8 n=1 Tax=Hevea brasiliensis TaxID=3981 RepID=UPI0025EDD624|nr:zinc finger protein CONSTANS-LIKE 8 [Hevea brasiliensis]
MTYEFSPLKTPKKEEQEAAESIVDDPANGRVDVMDEFDGVLGIEDDDEKFSKSNNVYGLTSWEFMDWEEEEPPNNENGEDEGTDHYSKFEDRSCRRFFEEDSHFCRIKREITAIGFLNGDDEDEYNRVSLNLNLNYQEVLDAWSDRGPLWANGSSLSSIPNNAYYMGEVPVMEEERTRREASVLRYKEKRHTRLFSKKIRYQVRKINADKRPRLKGRFVKRVS